MTTPSSPCRPAAESHCCWHYLPAPPPHRCFPSSPSTSPAASAGTLIVSPPSLSSILPNHVLSSLQNRCSNNSGNQSAPPPPSIPDFTLGSPLSSSQSSSFFRRNQIQQTSFETPPRHGPRDSKMVGTDLAGPHHHHHDMIAHSPTCVLRPRRSPSCRTRSNTDIDGDNNNNNNNNENNNDCYGPPAGAGGIEQQQASQHSNDRALSNRGGGSNENSQISSLAKSTKRPYRHHPRKSTRRRNNGDGGRAVVLLEHSSRRDPPALSSNDESFSFSSREQVHEAADSRRRRGILLPLSLGSNDEDDDTGHRHHHGDSCALGPRPPGEFLKFRRTLLPRDLQ
jgi:hypothetical protein